MKSLKNYVGSELGKGSLILFVMINVFNFFNYAFHFAMARLLTPADYGVLGVLLSFVYIYSLPSEAIQGIFSKYTSKFGENKKRVKFLIVKGFRKSLQYGLISIVIADIIAIFVSKYLNINFWLIFLTNFLIIFILFVSILRGILQGKKKFYGLGWSMIIDAVSKLLIGIGMVLIGFQVFGSVVGIILGVVISIFYSIFVLREFIFQDSEEDELQGMKGYSTSFIGAMIAIVFTYSLDIILARRFFDADIVGKYAAISMLSKMIFFGTIPISKALFPISSEKFHNKESTKNLFYKSALIVFTLCAISIAFFILFPKQLIGILFGSKYLDFSPYLIFTGIALTFLSFTNLIILYGLSIERFKKFYLLFVFIILEIYLLFTFNANILQFCLAFMFSNIFMFLGSLAIFGIKN